MSQCYFIAHNYFNIHNECHRIIDDVTLYILKVYGKNASISLHKDKLSLNFIKLI